MTETQIHWTRWRSGKFRLYLSSGVTLDFEGRLRLSTDRSDDTINKYEVETIGGRLIMAPRFDAVLAIEKLT